MLTDKAFVALAQANYAERAAREQEYSKAAIERERAHHEELGITHATLPRSTKTNVQCMDDNIEAAERQRAKDQARAAASSSADAAAVPEPLDQRVHACVKRLPHRTANRSRVKRRSSEGSMINGGVSCKTSARGPAGRVIHPCSSNR